MNKKIFLIIVWTIFYMNILNGQENIWNLLQAHCGKSYSGSLINPEYEEGFSDQDLVMHIISCNDSIIHIPFHVGEDRSRTWILKKQEIGYSLQHDHRHENGQPEEETLYGGFMSNQGNDELYMFPADQYTCELISKACGNVWWITMDDHYFTYNLRRIGTDRVFSIRFDLTKPVATPPAPWGWNK